MLLSSFAEVVIAARVEEVKVDIDTVEADMDPADTEAVEVDAAAARGIKGKKFSSTVT